MASAVFDMEAGQCRTDLDEEAPPADGNGGYLLFLIIEMN